MFALRSSHRFLTSQERIKRDMRNANRSLPGGGVMSAEIADLEEEDEEGGEQRDVLSKGAKQLKKIVSKLAGAEGVESEDDDDDDMEDEGFGGARRRGKKHNPYASEVSSTSVGSRDKDRTLTRATRHRRKNRMSSSKKSTDKFPIQEARTGISLPYLRGLRHPLVPSRSRCQPRTAMHGHQPYRTKQRSPGRVGATNPNLLPAVDRPYLLVLEQDRPSLPNEPPVLVRYPRNPPRERLALQHRPRQELGPRGKRTKRFQEAPAR